MTWPIFVKINNFLEKYESNPPKFWAKFSMYWIILQFLGQLWIVHIYFNRHDLGWGGSEMIRAYEMGAVKYFLFKLFLFGFCPIIIGWTVYYINKKTGIFEEKKKNKK
jgi:hypothetical protein